MRNDTTNERVAGGEWPLLIECARPTPDVPRLKQELRDPFDWCIFCDLAEEHGVLGLAARALLDQHQIELPPEAAETLRSWRRSHALFTLHLTAEMFSLFDCFGKSGIEVLVTKGPALSVRCYGDPGLRQYGDLDLVVRNKDISRVTELMTGLGYEATVPLSAIRTRKIPGEYNFRLKTSRLLVEFHTERTFRYHPRRLPLDDLFRRRAYVDFDSRQVPALSPEDELILICIHGAKHFWERLGFIADVAAFLARQKIDWQKAESAAAEVGAERMLSIGLRLAVDFLGAALPESIHAITQSDAAVRKLAVRIADWLPAAGSTPPGIFERAMFRIGMHGRALGGFAYLLRLSFSPTEEDWAGGEEGKRLWLLDAAGRPFRLARKYSNSHKPCPDKEKA